MIIDLVDAVVFDEIQKHVRWFFLNGCVLEYFVQLDVTWVIIDRGVRYLQLLIHLTQCNALLICDLILIVQRLQVCLSKSEARMRMVQGVWSQHGQGQSQLSVERHDADLDGLPDGATAALFCFMHIFDFKMLS